MVHSIVARSLEKRFKDVHAVRGLDFEVEAGRCFGLLGPNGAGKTTTINILVGLEEADGGDVEVLGLDWKQSATEIRARIGVQLQETQLLEKLTVVELLTLFQSFYPRPRPVDEVLALISLEEKAKARYRNLSGGQKQRLALGCALVSRPEILFLDEPTTGLDPQARRRVWEIVRDFKREGGTVLLTTHYMDEAEQLCDHLVIVDHGQKIAEGSPSALVASLGVRQVIEFRVAGVEFDRDELHAIPGVVEAEWREDVHRLEVEDAIEVLGALVGHLRQRDLTMDQLRTHQPTLEDVFVHLTGRSLRDG